MLFLDDGGYIITVQQIVVTSPECFIFLEHHQGHVLLFTLDYEIFFSTSSEIHVMHSHVNIGHE
jgi:hypothetical protein